MTAKLKLEIEIDDFEINHPNGLIIRLPATYKIPETDNLYLHESQTREVQTYLLTKIKN